MNSVGYICENKNTLSNINKSVALMEVQRACMLASTTHTHLSPVSIAQVIITVACSCEELGESAYFFLK